MSTLLRGAVVSAMWLAPLVAAAQPAVPSAPRSYGVFELRAAMTLGEGDRIAILEVANGASDRRIKKIVELTLPFQTQLFQVVYEAENFGTWVVETRLDIFPLDGRLWASDFLKSLDVRRGRWATRRDLARRELRRRFTVAGVEVVLPQPDDVTYEELLGLLRAIKGKSVVWPDGSPPVTGLRIENIEHIGVSGPPRLYHIFLASPQLPTLYVVDVEFDGTTVVVKRSAIGIP
jgi:hypothetical protein